MAAGRRWWFYSNTIFVWTFICALRKQSSVNTCLSFTQRPLAFLQNFPYQETHCRKLQTVICRNLAGTIVDKLEPLIMSVKGPVRGLPKQTLVYATIRANLMTICWKTLPDVRKALSMMIQVGASGLRVVSVVWEASSNCLGRISWLEQSIILAKDLYFFLARTASALFKSGRTFPTCLMCWTSVLLVIARSIT